MGSSKLTAEFAATQKQQCPPGYQVGIGFDQFEMDWKVG
jgi:hypothetical protein